MFVAGVPVVEFGSKRQQEQRELDALRNRKPVEGVEQQLQHVFDNVISLLCSPRTADLQRVELIPRIPGPADCYSSQFRR